jgi:hypothetical protein
MGLSALDGMITGSAGAATASGYRCNVDNGQKRRCQPCINTSKCTGPRHTGGHAMAMVMIKCPSSGHAVSTGIELEEQTFIELPDVGSGMHCSACGGHHIWQKRDAWLSNGSAGSPPPQK